MRKEIILAIILGVILGLVIIFGINLANQSVSQNTPPTPTPTITTAPSQDTVLQITSPKDNNVSNQDTITVTGVTQIAAWVSLIWEDGETIIKSNQNGEFQQEINLVGGENVIQITSGNGKDFQESTEITIIYTTTNIKEDPQPTTQELEATPSAEQVSQNLKARIQDIVSNKTNLNKDVLKGYTGIITQINSSAIVVNISDNQTLQITTSEDTDIVRNGKDIKVENLSIDEKLIIIGYPDTEDILSARRLIAIKDTSPSFSRQAIIGTLSNIQAKGLDIDNVSISIPNKTTIQIEGLQESQIVMVITQTDLEDNIHTLLALQPLLQ